MTLQAKRAMPDLQRYPLNLAPKPLKLSVYFFQWAGLEKLGYEHAFQLYTYSLRPFSMGRWAWDASQALQRFRPPAFIGLRLLLFWIVEFQCDPEYKYFVLHFTISLQEPQCWYFVDTLILLKCVFLLIIFFFVFLILCWLMLLLLLFDVVVFVVVVMLLMLLLLCCCWYCCCCCCFYCCCCYCCFYLMLLMLLVLCCCCCCFYCCCYLILLMLLLLCCCCVVVDVVVTVVAVVILAVNLKTLMNLS